MRLLIDQTHNAFDNESFWRSQHVSNKCAYSIRKEQLRRLIKNLAEESGNELEEYNDHGEYTFRIYFAKQERKTDFRGALSRYVQGNDEDIFFVN